MYIRLLMYPVQMPSLMYLIFAKKQRIRFFDPTGGLVGQIFFTLIVLDSVNHWAPFSRAWVQNRFLPRRHRLIFFRIAWHIFMSSVPGSIFPANKMCFICSKENSFFSNFLVACLACAHCSGIQAYRHSFKQFEFPATLKGLGTYRLWTIDK